MSDLTSTRPSTEEACAMGCLGTCWHLNELTDEWKTEEQREAWHAKAIERLAGGLMADLAWLFEGLCLERDGYGGSVSILEFPDFIRQHNWPDPVQAFDVALSWELIVRHVKAYGVEELRRRR